MMRVAMNCYYTDSLFPFINSYWLFLDLNTDPLYTFVHVYINSNELPLTSKEFS